MKPNMRLSILFLLSLLSASYAIEEVKHQHNNEGVGMDSVGMHSSTAHIPVKKYAFFTPNDLKVGKVMQLSSIGAYSSNSLHFLPREEANLLPFSSSKLPFLLDFFAFPEGSPQALSMEDTLKTCEAKPLPGEIRFCATSLESMLDFVHKILGQTTQQVKVLSTPLLEELILDKNKLYNYTIVDEPKEVGLSKMVACHITPYPYVIYFCHTPDAETKVFQVPIKVENYLVDVVVNCHMNTSQWNPDHASFQVSGIKHGSPVCHFMPSDHLNWISVIEDDDDDHHEFLPKIAQL